MSHTKPVREGDTRRCPECGGFQVLVPVGSDRADMTMHLTQDMARDILPLLAHFVEHGDLPATPPPSP